MHIPLSSVHMCVLCVCVCVCLLCVCVLFCVVVVLGEGGSFVWVPLYQMFGYQLTPCWLEKVFIVVVVMIVVVVDVDFFLTTISMFEK